MSNPLSDDRLTELYARRSHPSPRSGAEPAVSVETLHALAAGSYRGADRIALLDAVLADPILAAEFQVLRDLVDSAPAPTQRIGPRLLALAAVLATFTVTGLVWLALLRGTKPEPLRGAGYTPSLITPAAGGVVGRGDRLVWHPFAGATGYEAQLVDGEGRVVFRSAAAETTAVVPDSVRIVPGAAYLWWVTASRGDGSLSRAAPIAVRGRAP